ncbi:FAD-dependent thymidylate synthase [Candidatus Tisiphia endosymbiont of Beris chalybata]|uniref:FAD-dependent thymidylate synthase n=1 Tax=Candidatus Tisiphia endosymbiont of Beris chalybata TaxID=3066262 RepID=UPI00312C9334
MHNNYTTKRATVPALEELLFEPLKVLDHGFIRVIDYMGDDSSIVQAARVSYGKGTKQLNQDKGLIYYLMRHKHTTPFEMCDIKFHIKLPIFVARQWIRHRTASVNEYSARYSILGNEFYLPARENLASQSLTNKQGRSNEDIPKEVADKVLALLEKDAKMCYQHYTEIMNQDEQGNIIDPNAIGITRELARMNLTLNYYTEWYWKVNLHNLLNFLLLRADPHAQYEIRVYADKMLEIVQKWLPLTYGAFNEYRIEGFNISKKGLAVIKKLLNNENITQETSTMSKREWDELMEVIK